MQRIGDCHAHIWRPQMGEHRAVSHLHETLNDRLGVHNDIHALIRRAKQVMSLHRASSPLFMSVAESIVIFPPISQVGCASACLTVTLSSCVCV